MHRESDPLAGIAGADEDHMEKSEVSYDVLSLLSCHDIYHIHDII